METIAKQIVLKIGNAINKRYLAGKTFVPQSSKFKFMCMICIICFALFRDVVCLAFCSKVVEIFLFITVSMKKRLTHKCLSHELEGEYTT